MQAPPASAVHHSPSRRDQPTAIADRPIEQGAPRCVAQQEAATGRGCRIAAMLRNAFAALQLIAGADMT
jgi:hypothetical protein